MQHGKLVLELNLICLRECKLPVLHGAALLSAPDRPRAAPCPDRQRVARRPGRDLEDKNEASVESSRN